MAFTYDGPTSGDKDKVRFLVGDTVGSAHLLEDDEVQYLLISYGTVAATVIPALDAMIAKASLRVNRSSAGESVSWKDLADSLRRRRAELLAQGYTDPAPTSALSNVRRLARPSTTVTEFTT